MRVADATSAFRHSESQRHQGTDRPCDHSKHSDSKLIGHDAEQANPRAQSNVATNIAMLASRAAAHMTSSASESACPPPHFLATSRLEPGERLFCQVGFRRIEFRQCLQHVAAARVDG